MSDKTSSKKYDKYDDEEKYRVRDKKDKERKVYSAYDDIKDDFKPKAKNRKKRSYNDDDYQWGKPEEEPEENVETKKKKQKPSFKPSGLLEKDQRVVEKGIETKFVLPPEARIPEDKWVLVPFKHGEPLDPYYIYRKSHYLLGRDKDINDIPLLHPSCSKQHAVIVFRQFLEEDDLGRKTSIIKPYIMDLGSTNGTFINNVEIDDMRYVELFEKDSIRFGASSREFILIIDKTKDS